MAEDRNDELDTVMDDDTTSDDTGADDGQGADDEGGTGEAGSDDTGEGVTPEAFARMHKENVDLRKALAKANADAQRLRRRTETGQQADGARGGGASSRPVPAPSAAPSAAPASQTEGGAATPVAVSNEHERQLAEAQRQVSDLRRGMLVAEARAALAAAGAKEKQLPKLVRMVDLSALELDESGTVTGLKEQIDSIREDFGVLFQRAQKPAVTPPLSGPRDGSGAAKPKTSTEKAVEQLTSGRSRR